MRHTPTPQHVSPVRDARARVSRDDDDGIDDDDDEDGLGGRVHALARARDARRG